jgi:hypothetical protein
VGCVGSFKAKVVKVEVLLAVRECRAIARSLVGREWGMQKEIVILGGCHEMIGQCATLARLASEADQQFM